MRSTEEVLVDSFKNLKMLNPSFSMRSLAQRLEISPGYLSKIFSGKKKLPQSKVDQFSKALRMDELTREELELSLDLSKLSDKSKDKVKTKIKENNHGIPTTTYEEKGVGDFWMLEKWYRYQIYSLLSLKTFSRNPFLICSELGIKENTLKRTLEDMIQRGYVSIDELGHYKVSERGLRFTNSKYNHIAREFGDSMIQLARQELANNTSQNSFMNRRISCNTFPIHSSQVESFREEVKRAAYDLVHKYREQCKQLDLEPDSLYQYNYQFFPISYMATRLEQSSQSA